MSTAITHIPHTGAPKLNNDKSKTGFLEKAMAFFERVTLRWRDKVEKDNEQTKSTLKSNLALLSVAMTRGFDSVAKCATEKEKEFLDNYKDQTKPELLNSIRALEQELYSL